MLYPAELRTHMEFLVPSADELRTLRRQTLYPTELQGRIAFIFYPFFSGLSIPNPAGSPLDFFSAPRYNGANQKRMVNCMTPEKDNQKLTRWLLLATIALLVLVLGLQLWQMLGRRPYGDNGSPDSANGPAASPAAEPHGSPDVSPGKTAMIKDVQALNPALSFDALAALSAEELEQLYETGAPGLPIGVSAAALAAETYAGTLEVNAVTSETDPELDESPAHYEVELYHPTLGDFEYKIDAYTGQVLEGASNILQSGYVPASGGEETPSAPPADSAQPSSQLSADAEERAKNAAFTHAGVSAGDVSALHCELDWDDGLQVYDVEFWVGGTEYDYEVEAATGAIRKAEQKRNGGTAGETPSLIGEEAAKSAAFTHAGVSAGDASALKCKLEEDDGRWLYEIEFRLGGVEYDYEIDAASGSVLKAEREH